MFKNGLKNGKGKLFELYGRMWFPTIVGVFPFRGQVKMFDSSQRLVFKDFMKRTDIRGQHMILESSLYG